MASSLQRELELVELRLHGVGEDDLEVATAHVLEGRGDRREGLAQGHGAQQVEVDLAGVGFGEEPGEDELAVEGGLNVDLRGSEVGQVDGLAEFVGGVR